MTLVSNTRLSRLLSCCRCFSLWVEETALWYGLVLLQKQRVQVQLGESVLNIKMDPQSSWTAQNLFMLNPRVFRSLLVLSSFLLRATG